MSDENKVTERPKVEDYQMGEELFAEDANRYIDHLESRNAGLVEALRRIPMSLRNNSFYESHLSTNQVVDLEVAVSYVEDVLEQADQFVEANKKVEPVNRQLVEALGAAYDSLKDLIDSHDHPELNEEWKQGVWYQARISLEVSGETFGIKRQTRWRYF